MGEAASILCAEGLVGLIAYDVGEACPRLQNNGVVLRVALKGVVHLPEIAQIFELGEGGACSMVFKSFVLAVLNL